MELGGPKRWDMCTPSIQKNLSTNIEKSTPKKSAPTAMTDSIMKASGASPKRSENYNSDQEEVKSDEL